MSLSCDCSDDFDWWYSPADDYAPLATKRCRKCASCRERIPVGALSLKLWCYKYPECNSVEEKIYGEGGEVPMADKYFCERCTDLYFSLTELGFCINLGDDMRELVKEYAEVYGPNRKA